MKHRISALASAAGSLASQAVGFGLVLAALSGSVYAPPATAPEVDPSSMLSALALLSCGMLILTNRARRK